MGVNFSPQKQDSARVKPPDLGAKGVSLRLQQRCTRQRCTSTSIVRNVRLRGGAPLRRPDGDYPVSLFSTRVLASAGAVARSGRNSRGTATARRGWLARRAWRLAASRVADGERRKTGPRGAGQANALGQKMELGSRGFPCEATRSPWREEHCFLGVQKQHGRGGERRTSLAPSRS